MDTHITPGDVVRLEGLDLPTGAEFHYVQHPKGVHEDICLRVMIARPKREEPRGSILFHPGRSEFIEKFFETVQDLVNRGFVVMIMDPRGQGLSSRMLGDRLKGWVGSFDHYCEDFAYLADVFKADLPRPHIVMGHSMGSTIGLQTILSGRLNPTAGVFSAPMLQLQDMNTPFMGELVRFLAWAGMKQNSLPFQASRNGQPGAFIANKLTNDPNRYQLWATYFENHKKLRIGPPTFGWIAEALKSMKFVRDNAAHLTIPTLVTASGADSIVTPASIEEFAREAQADFVNFPGCKHEVLLELDEDRNRFWDEFDGFLERNGL